MRGMIFSAVLAAISCSASAVDPFAVYQTENNAKRERISVFSMAMNDLYRNENALGPTVIWGFGAPWGVSQRERWSTWERVSFGEPHWSREWPGLGVARYRLGNGVSGWMSFELDAAGEVASIAWTHTPDAELDHGAEMGQAADIATTAPQFALEANPVVAEVGLWPIAAIKLAASTLIEAYGSHAACAAWRDAAQDVGWWAAGNNAIVLAAGAGGPAVLAGALAAGVLAADYSSARHNGFWACLPDDLRGAF